jgi:protein SCO1/2
MKSVATILGALALSLAVSACKKPTPRTDHVPLQTYDFGGDFTLTDQNGARYTMSEHRGRITLLFFGYTLCPDVCPTTLSKLTQVYRSLGPRSDSVSTVFVSVDPDRDTPQALRDYLQNFGIKVVGLTGTRQDVDTATSKFRVSYTIEQSDSAAGYLVSHTTLLYLIDEQGRLRHMFKHSDSPETITTIVKQLMDDENAH